MKDGLYHIIFVCTGNICRSPMAEGILRARLSPAALEFATVGSAGIAAPQGCRASEHSVTVCRDNGIDIRGHRSRQLMSHHVDAADLILVMEDHHRSAVIRYAPEALEKTFLISEYPPGVQRGRGPGIEDPIGQELDAYRGVYRQLDGYVSRLLPHLEASIAETGKRA